MPAALSLQAPAMSNSVRATQFFRHVTRSGDVAVRASHYHSETRQCLARFCTSKNKKKDIAMKPYRSCANSTWFLAVAAFALHQEFARSPTKRRP
jgi:hypothetical protein